jgi:hypothetical protein
MRIARYAFNTANLASPARAVTDADVLNAFATPSLNPTLDTGTLNLLANLGDLPGASRDIMVMNPSTYRQICVNFPPEAGAPPTLVNCPSLAFTLWMDEPYTLDVSRDAIAAAARRGHPVSGADIVRAAKSHHLRLMSRPTFGAGKGGVVTFIATLKTNSRVTTGDFCVAMPRQRYGIPRVVSCSSN